MNTNYNTVLEHINFVETKESAYQTEAQLEKSFIDNLVSLGYQYKRIHSESEAITNLRNEVERLNGVAFNDKEWDRFFVENICNPNDTYVEKISRIQREDDFAFEFDNGKFANLKLIDKKNLHKNRLQVINQYRDNDNKSRYDVTLLVNGLPMVHIELKKRGVDIEKAFMQIERYQEESFFKGSKLFHYVHIFVISNGTNTRYYSSSTRSNVVKENTSDKTREKSSYKFTSEWADLENHKVKTLETFTGTFLSPETLLNVITKYCVFTNPTNELKVMRPYQIAAVEKIINKVYWDVENNIFNGTKLKTGKKIKMAGSDMEKDEEIGSGGFIWHTTGSGKTMTSFRVATLLRDMPEIDKVIFLVDRNDLDYQTKQEYDKFQKGCVASVGDTKELKRRLETDDRENKIIISTIQKFNVFVKKNAEHPIYNKKVVFIFDECHRSQFGSMHKNITTHFKKYMKFGLTGTPIFEDNSHNHDFTTEEFFGEMLHKYTVRNAISDGNVLAFNVQYFLDLDDDGNIVK